MSQRSHSFLRRIILAALASLSCASIVDAQQPVTRGWALNNDGAIKIYGDAGSVRVIGWNRDSVAVTGTVAATGTFFGGGDRNGVKLGIETSGGPSKPSELVVYVPARSRVWIRSASSNVDVTTFSGALDIATVGGTVRVVTTPSELRAESMNGTLNISASPNYLRLRSATGAIVWNGSSDDVGITTVSGRVVVAAGTVRRARVESIDGEVRFGGRFVAKSDLAIDTHSGNVTLSVEKGSNVSLDVSARGCELFGVRQGQDRSGLPSVPPKTFYKNVGQPVPGEPSVVVRSYKGFVTAVMQ